MSTSRRSTVREKLLFWATRTAVLVILTSQSIALPSPLKAQQGEVQLVVRPVGLSDSALARVIEELIRGSRAEQWETVRVKQNESLSRILYQRYRVGDSYRPASGATIRAAVAQRNGLDSLFSLAVDQDLKLPPLPQFPEWQPPQSAVKAQQDWNKGRVSILRSSRTAVSETNDVPIGDPHFAPEWRITLPYSETDPAFAVLQTDLLRLSPTAFLDVREVVDFVGEATLEAARPFEDDGEILSELSPPSTNRNSTKSSRTPRISLFLLDFFGAEPCGHGERVRDVVTLALSQMGLAELASSADIIPIDLNLRNDSAGKSQVVERWLQTSGRGGRPGWSSSQKTRWREEFQRSIASIRNSPVVYPVSMLYYQAVMDSIRRTSGFKVVSSSFQVEVESVGPFRSLSFPPSEMEFYFSAAGNDDKALEELGNWDRRQPQSTYHAVSQFHPLFLVSGELPSGKRRGVWSRRSPWAVPFVGQAGGWGTKATCVNPKSSATSYATPSVAATLFGAMHTWRAEGIKLSGRDEVVRRLLSSVRVNSKLLGNHAGPGVPQLDRLSYTGQSHMVLRDGRSMASASGVTGSITLKVGSSQTSFQLGQRKGNELWALQTAGSEVFFISSGSATWQSATISDVSITLPFEIPACSVRQERSCKITSGTALTSLLSSLTLAP